MKFTIVYFCAMAVLGMTAFARPALQPFPRECVWGSGVVDASALPVVRDDVRQCEIGCYQCWLDIPGFSIIFR